MKILLVQPGYLYSPKWGKKQSLKPYLLYLYSFLKKQHHDVEVLDLEVELGRPWNEKLVEQYKKKSMKLLSKYDFDVLGISCWLSLSYTASLLVAKMARKINPHCKIVVGGYHPTAVPKDFVLKEKLFDYVITGEGSITLSNLLRNLKNNTHKKTKIIKGVPDDFKNYLELDVEGYGYMPEERKTGIYLSKGCPFSCYFCMEPCKGNSWVSYSVKNSIKKIEEVVAKLNPKRISFYDPCFGLDTEWRRKFLRELVRRKFDVSFWAETRHDLLSKKDIDLISQLDFRIDFGLESASIEMLKIMNKSSNPARYLEQFEKVSNHCDKKEVLHTTYLTFNHPGETRATIKESFKYLFKLLNKKYKTFLTFGGGKYVFFPGSQVYYNMEYYERIYRTIIMFKEWWKERKNYYRLASSVIPSSDLAEDINMWEKRYDNLLKLNYEKHHDDWESKFKRGIYDDFSMDNAAVKDRCS